MKKRFPVINLMRDDVETIGYKADNLTDEIMERIAARMGNVLLDDFYWVALREVCEDMELLCEDEEEENED